MKNPIEVSCECRADVGEPCRGFSFEEFHRYRYQRAVTYGRKASPVTNVPGPRVKIVEPIGDSSLVESFTITVRCPNRGCKAAPGVRCNATRVEWHAQRVKRGVELKARYDNQ